MGPRGPSGLTGPLGPAPRAPPVASGSTEVPGALAGPRGGPVEPGFKAHLAPREGPVGPGGHQSPRGLRRSPGGPRGLQGPPGTTGGALWGPGAFKAHLVPCPEPPGTQGAPHGAGPRPSEVPGMVIYGDPRKLRAPQGPQGNPRALGSMGSMDPRTPGLHVGPHAVDPGKF